MKKIATTLVVLAILGLAAAAWAAAPLPGNYQSTDLGGTIPTGRYTEGWDAGGNAFGVGTTQNCGSWDGAARGGVWRYTCGTCVSPAVVISNTVNAQGNGQKTFMQNYVGGIFWLSGTGPWANGDADYPGAFDSYVEYETVQYANFVPFAAVTNVQAMAHFNNYQSTCIGFSIGNGTRVGTTDLGGTFPANYPALIDANCNATRTLGAWWNFTSISLTLTGDCATGIKPATWGAIKSMYR